MKSETEKIQKLINVTLRKFTNRSKRVYMAYGNFKGMMMIGLKITVGPNDDDWVELRMRILKVEYENLCYEVVQKIKSNDEVACKLSIKNYNNGLTFIRDLRKNK